MIRYVSEDRRDSMKSDVAKFLLKRRLSDGHLLNYADTFHVTLVICSATNIYDHHIYSRQLHPSKFDENQSCLAFLRDEATDQPLLTYVKRSHKDTCDIAEELTDIPEDVISENLYIGEDDIGNSVYVLLMEDPISGLIREIHVPMFRYTHVLLSPSIKAQIEMDAHLASCVLYEMNRSRKFRKKFLHYLRRHKSFRNYNNADTNVENESITANLYIPCLIEIHLILPKQKIDYAWDYRISGELKKRVNLEENMAWLNTLGGGYGALGDYFLHHATKAGEISIHQLKISLELGDQISAAKCRLFFAQSLLQCGYLKQCKRIVKLQYKFAQSLNVRDEKLEAMCISYWNRLRYILSINKNNKGDSTAAFQPPNPIIKDWGCIHCSKK